MGYLDRNCRARSQMKSFVRYGNTVTKLSYGLLIMVVDHMSGDVHDVKSFNTHHSRKESDRLTKYIRWLPRGMIVLGVVHSDWTAYSTPQLNTALVCHVDLLCNLHQSLKLVKCGKLNPSLSLFSLLYRIFFSLQFNSLL